METNREQRISELRARRDELRAVVDKNRENIAKFQLSKLLETCINVSRPVPNSTTIAMVMARFKEKETKFDLPFAQVDFDTILNLGCMAFGGNPSEMMLAMLDVGNVRVLLPRDWRLNCTSPNVLKIEVELIPRGRCVIINGEEEETMVSSSPPKQLARKQKELSSSSMKLDVSKTNVDSTIALSESKQVRYVGVELVLHIILFILLGVGLWVGNGVNYNAALLKQTIEAQVSISLPPEHGNARFGINITNTPTLWAWMNNGPLTKLLLFNGSSNQLISTCLPTGTLSVEECEFSTSPTMPWLIYSGNLAVVGNGVQFRQYRVSINTCGSPSFFPCYGTYSAETMETRRFRGTALQHDNNNSLCGFTWVNRVQTEQPITTSFGMLLDQSGYLFTVVNPNKLLPGLRFLQENQWIDAATRAITIQFVLENVHTGGLLAARLLIEVNEIGNVYTNSRYYTNVGMSSTRLATNIVALLVELLILGVTFAMFKRNNSNNSIWAVRLWDICFAILFVASFALDASLMQPANGSGFAQVQAVDTQMHTANQFRAVLVVMLSVRLCGLAFMFTPAAKYTTLMWKVPLLYLGIVALMLPLYCSLALFWMVLHGTQVDFAAAMQSLFNLIVFAAGGEQDNDVFVLVMLTFCWVFCVPTLLAGTMVFVNKHV